MADIKYNKICHLADIHIRKVPTRNDEYIEVFNNLYKSLRKTKPDLIVIVGDLVHDYLDLQGEQLILATDFLNTLATIAPVRVTRGNHDCRKKSLKRVDSIEAIVKAIKNPNVIYYNKTKFYEDNNIIWAVWHHGDPKNNPWKLKEAKEVVLKRNDGKTIIDLYHDPINGCLTMDGFEMARTSLTMIGEFKGDFSFFGDIHRIQFLDKEQTKAYPSSLISQDISEGDENFHGYLLWDISTKCADIIPVRSSYSHKNIKITPYTDFDDLDFEIENPTEFMKVRFVWNTLPSTRNKDNERKVVAYLKQKYQNLTIAHKNLFIENDIIEINDKVELVNITNPSVQHEIFKEYLMKIGISEEMISNIIKLDDEITSTIEIEDSSNYEWNIIKFGAENFTSYEKFDIDWRDMEGLFQITGENTVGKCVDPETEIEIEYCESEIVNKIGFIPQILL